MEIVSYLGKQNYINRFSPNNFSYYLGCLNNPSVINLANLVLHSNVYLPFQTWTNIQDIQTFAIKKSQHISALDHCSIQVSLEHMIFFPLCTSTKQRQASFTHPTMIRFLMREKSRLRSSSLSVIVQYYFLRHTAGQPVQ